MKDNAQQTPRRRFFRRAAIAGAFAGLGGFGLGAFARGRGGPGGWGGGALDPAEFDQRLDRMLKHLYVEIDATPEQQQKLGPIVKGAAKDLMPMRREMREARRQAMDLFTRDHVDRAAFEKLRAAQMSLADRASKRLTEALADAAEVLTPLQRKLLSERMHRFGGRRWHGRG
jgi:Spy/CpxP family protein refolding chaperone